MRQKQKCWVLGMPLVNGYPQRKYKGIILKKYCRGSETLYDVQKEDNTIEKEIYSDYISIIPENPFVKMFRDKRRIEKCLKEGKSLSSLKDIEFVKPI